MLNLMQFLKKLFKLIFKIKLLFRIKTHWKILFIKWHLFIFLYFIHIFMLLVYIFFVKFLHIFRHLHFFLHFPQFIYFSHCKKSFSHFFLSNLISRFKIKLIFFWDFAQQMHFSWIFFDHIICGFLLHQQT